MKFISDLSKDIILLAQREPFLIVTRLHSCMIFVFMAQFIPPDPSQFAFFLAYCQNPSHDFPFSLKKKRKEKV